MHIVVWLPDGWSDSKVAAELSETGIVSRPLSSLTLENWQRPGLVLGYTGFQQKDLLAAVESMSALFRAKGAGKAKRVAVAQRASL